MGSFYCAAATSVATAARRLDRLEQPVVGPLVAARRCRGRRRARRARPCRIRWAAPARPSTTHPPFLSHPACAGAAAAHSGGPALGCRSTVAVRAETETRTAGVAPGGAVVRVRVRPWGAAQSGRRRQQHRQRRAARGNGGWGGRERGRGGRRRRRRCRCRRRRVRARARARLTLTETRCRRCCG